TDRVERFSVHRPSVHALKFDRQRQRGGLRADCRGEEESVERQNSRAVAGRGFGKDLDIDAVAERAAYLVSALDATTRVFPIDEDRSAELREPSEQRPATHFSLRDEQRRKDRGDNDDVQIALVIADEQAPG